jgi:hypothetical protein
MAGLVDSQMQADLKHLSIALGHLAMDVRDGRIACPLNGGQLFFQPEAVIGVVVSHRTLLPFD